MTAPLHTHEKQASVRMLLNPIHLLAFGFGSGLSPVSPGTIGTLCGWGIFLLCNTLWPTQLDPGIWLIIVCVAFLAGIPICALTAKALGVPDHGSIVWDEIVAIWLVLLFVWPCSFDVQLAAFILFRFFDILKPPPIRYFDQHMKNGLGVMWDDIIAAFYALLVLAIWRTLSAILFS